MARRILIMEDERCLRKVYNQFLTTIGYTVKAVATGEAAISEYIKDAFDVVVLDINIVGGLGGKETIKELIIMDPATKAIAMSGDVKPGLIELGFAKTMMKPFRLQELKLAIDELMPNLQQTT